MPKLFCLSLLLFMAMCSHAQDNVKVDNRPVKHKGGPMDSAHIIKAKELAQKRLAKFYKKRYQYLFRRKYAKPIGRKNGI